MKSAFIPITLRPKVNGMTFGMSDISYAEEEISDISSIDDVTNLCSRRKIIAKIIKNVSSGSADDMVDGPVIKMMRQLEHIFLRQDNHRT